MEDKIICKKCESDNIQFVAEPVRIERNTKYIFIIVCTILAILILIGFFMIISSLIHIKNISDELEKNLQSSISYKNLEELFASYLTYETTLYNAQLDILTGLIVMFTGFIPLILLLIFHSLAPSFTIQTKTKAICQNCGRKWDFKAEREKQELEELHN